MCELHAHGKWMRGAEEEKKEIINKMYFSTYYACALHPLLSLLWCPDGCARCRRMWAPQKRTIRFNLFEFLAAGFLPRPPLSVLLLDRRSSDDYYLSTSMKYTPEMVQYRFRASRLFPETLDLYSCSPDRMSNGDTTQNGMRRNMENVSCPITNTL